MDLHYLVVVVDRGSFKAYHAEGTPTRGTRLRLHEAFDLKEGHQRLQDQVTDEAGRFPRGDAGSGRHANSAGERGSLDLESDRRLVHRLAERIDALVADEKPAGWLLAAPERINGDLMATLSPPLRSRLLENVVADLVKIDAAKLPDHFRTLREPSAAS